MATGRELIGETVTLNVGAYKDQQGVVKAYDPGLDQYCIVCDGYPDMYERGGFRTDADLNGRQGVMDRDSDFYA
jgi:hypothetical protein